MYISTQCHLISCLSRGSLSSSHMTLFLLHQQAKGLCPHLCDGYSLPARPLPWLLRVSRPSPSPYPMSGHTLCVILTHRISQLVSSECLLQAKSCSVCSIGLTSPDLTTTSRERSILVPILQMRKQAESGEATCPGSQLIGGGAWSQT